jgi:antitoxin HicB
MNAAYPYTVEPQESGHYLIQFIDFDDAFTEGATMEEAAFNAAEVLSLIVEQRLADGQAIPLPSPDDGHLVAYPQASIQASHDQFGLESESP